METGRFSGGCEDWRHEFTNLQFMATGRVKPSSNKKGCSENVLCPTRVRCLLGLSWLAKGKINRDIADILGMSRRKANKHPEHVFEKLGMETRSAAAIAGQLLPQA